MDQILFFVLPYFMCHCFSKVIEPNRAILLQFYWLSFLLSSIFTAFVIEAFILEYEREKEPNVSKLESRINELGLSFDQSLE